MKSTTFKLIALFGAASLLIAACGEKSNQKVSDQVNDIILTAGLDEIRNCDDLLDRIKTVALAEVGPFGLSEPHARINGGFRAVNDQILETETASEADMQNDSYEVNNQESQVNEGDWTLANEKYIVVARRSTLSVLSPETDQVVHTISLGSPSDITVTELFLTDDKVLAITATQSYPETQTRPSDEPTQPVVRTKLQVINLKTGKTEASSTMAGDHVTSRLIDGKLVVITRSFKTMSFVIPSGGSNGAAEIALKANQQVIRESSLEDWLGGADSDLLKDCSNIAMPKRFSGFGLTTVTTFNAGNDLEKVGKIAVFTDTQDIYVSKDRLVIATPDYVSATPVEDSSFKTALHSFDISGDRAELVGSGYVHGYLLNRYSLSYHNGHLRVATTIEGNDVPNVSIIPDTLTVEPDPAWQENAVVVFKEEQGALVETGRVDGLGKGERIFAVRYLGNIGYVVTFRQIDPLYTLDLSDPQAPKATGELKIPGVSRYLHPVSDKYLLGVGEGGSDRGLNGKAVATLFDVSDMDNPTMVDILQLSDHGHSSSPVWSNPKALRMWDDKALIPVRSLGEKSAVQIISVTDQLEQVGEISFANNNTCAFPFEPEVELPVEEPQTQFNSDATTLPAPPEDDICYPFSVHISRTFVIGGKIYSISALTVYVNDANSLKSLGKIPVFTQG